MRIENEWLERYYGHFDSFLDEVKRAFAKSTTGEEQYEICCRTEKYQYALFGMQVIIAKELSQTRNEMEIERRRETFDTKRLFHREIKNGKLYDTDSGREIRRSEKFQQEKEQKLPKCGKSR